MPVLPADLMPPTGSPADGAKPLPADPVPPPSLGLPPPLHLHPRRRRRHPPPVPRLVAPARRHCRRPPPRGLLFHRRQDTVGATRPLHARLVGHPPDGPNRLCQPLPLPRCPVLPRRGGGRVGHEVAGAARASIALNSRAGCLFAASTSVARGSASAPAPPHTSVATARRARWSVREWSWRWEMSTWPSMPA